MTAKQITVGATFSGVGCISKESADWNWKKERENKEGMMNELLDK